MTLTFHTTRIYQTFVSRRYVESVIFVSRSSRSTKFRSPKDCFHNDDASNRRYLACQMCILHNYNFPNFVLIASIHGIHVIYVLERTFYETKIFHNFLWSSEYVECFQNRCVIISTREFLIKETSIHKRRKGIRRTEPLRGLTIT